MPAPDAIRRLVENFDRNRDTYKSGNYNETQVRVDFIDPMFTALGWDVHNTKGYAEAYRDVIHEFSLKMGATTKAPDYCFRIGQAPKFFLEAKKPAVPLKDAKDAALQLRRYAWSAKLPVSILTDFDEFAVYDCRVKPDKNDSSSAARTEFFTYGEYEEKWDKIASVFSKEAILQGSFDKYVESKKKKRGTAEVDEAFLEEIENWRELLAKNVNLRNQGLAPHELNEAVQKTIDRIIFLRICEDRGIEPYAQLMGLLSGDGTYDRLKYLFHRADDRYNSGLFHFRSEKERGSPDTWTLNLEIDDKPLKEIVKKLYYPESPYEFSVLPADILGQVYEQFLGKVITPKGRSVTIEDKPEVKKAGGVYYTPTYIVDYIVEHTVGNLLEGKSTDEVAGKNRAKGAHPLRVLDPACGSGTFLIGAYQKLLDWHLVEYSKDPEKHLKAKTPRLRESGREGRAPARPQEYRLTTHERKRILLDHIYGVDIDPQAVEVTKLSLLLKVLEGESDTTLNVNLQLFHERALPDLDNNIKCGNSLIGPDFYDGPENATLPEGDRRRINAFDWKKEFTTFFGSEFAGFEVILGNPPWGASFSEPENAHLKQAHREHIARMMDSYLYFIIESKILLASSGKYGVIVPATILNQTDARPIRELLLTVGIHHLVNLGQKIFGPKVLNTSVIIIASRSTEPTACIRDLSNTPIAEKKVALQDVQKMPYDEWCRTVRRDPNLTFFTGQITGAALLNDLRDRHAKLADVLAGDIQRGVSPDVAEAHVLEESNPAISYIERAVLRNSISGDQVRKFRKPFRDQYVLYTHRGLDIHANKGALKYLSAHKDKNTCKEVKLGKHDWWALHRPRDPNIFLSPKFIGLTTSRELIVVLDEEHNFVVTDAMYVFSVRPDIDRFAFMAVFMSRVMLFLYRVSNQGESRVIPQVKASKLDNLPFPHLDSGNSLVPLLSKSAVTMIELHQRQDKAKASHDRALIERDIERTDREIDRLVYELYGLTEAEIKIVEEATK